MRVRSFICFVFLQIFFLSQIKARTMMPLQTDSRLFTKMVQLQAARDKILDRFFEVATICMGRLTTETAVPISVSDRATQSTIYFTPYQGSVCSLYDGSVWTLYNFTERSLALSGLTADKNYDVFLYDNAGTLTLELSAAWTNDTTRADALTTQNGVYVKSGATTRRHLGAIRTTSTTATEDSKAKRFVWNNQNRRTRFLFKRDEGSANWTYETATYRSANGNAANRVQYVVGMGDPVIRATLDLSAGEGDGGLSPSGGVGVNSTSANSSLAHGGRCLSGSVLMAPYAGFPGLGFHYLQWVEIGGGDGGTEDNFYSNVIGFLSGLFAFVEG